MLHFKSQISHFDSDSGQYVVPVYQKKKKMQINPLTISVFKRRPEKHNPAISCLLIVASSHCVCERLAVINILR